MEKHPLLAGLEFTTDELAQLGITSEDDLLAMAFEVAGWADQSLNPEQMSGEARQDLLEKGIRTYIQSLRGEHMST